MKLAEIKIESGEVFDENQYTLEVNSQAFEILSGQIYNDRIAAPIRELSANAWDAHVDAGTTDQKFLIHLPNDLEPYFKIRDYGTGLSEKDIRFLFTRYFKSNKTNSNDFIGCKGLGSKSPFAYTDAFMVTSYFNGMKYVFNCYKNAKKIPAITAMGESETTDEPNGLEISMAVRSTDFWDFRYKLQFQLQFFSNQPKVVGVDSFAFHKTDYIIKTDEYGISAKRSPSTVIMGGVGYTIEAKEFPTDGNSPYVLKGLNKKLIEWGVHLFVPMGTVEPAASRETLTMTPETLAVIHEVLTKAKDATEAEALKEISTAKTIWDARKLFGKLRHGVMGEICGLKETNFIMWQGVRISNVVIFSDYTMRPSIVHNLAIQEDDDGGGGGTKKRRHGNAKVTAQGDFRRWQASEMSAEDVNVIYINDLNRGGFAAARRDMEENGIKHAIMFSGDVTDEFIDEIGCRDLLILVSTLPKPERKARQSGGRGMRSLIQQWRPIDDAPFTNVEVDLADGGVYVECRWNKIHRPAVFGSPVHSFVPAKNIKDFVRDISILGGAEPIYAIRPCDIPKIKRYQKEWVTFDQHLEDVLRQNAKLLQEAVMCATYDSVHYSLNKLNQLRKHFTTGKIADILTIYDKTTAAKENAKIQAFLRLNNYAKIYAVEKSAAVIGVVVDALDSYPMLKHVGYVSDDNIQDAINYINLVDEMNEIIESQSLEDAA